MKSIKFPLIAAACFSLFLLTACSSFKSLNPWASDNGEQNNATMSEMTGTDNNFSDFDNESDTLPARPTKAWTPVKIKNFPTIYFGFDHSGIGIAEQPKLNAVANYLKKNPELGLIIQGNCDEKGSAEYNIGLGERRALSVQKYLENLGIPSSRMQTISYGSERPADPRHTVEAWQKNRRAELVPAKM